MKTCKQLSIEWGISERTVTNLCQTGKLPGAHKVGKSWQIPDDVLRPEDGRVREGTYIKGKRALPIGISDYVRAQADYYYVDKTLLIKDFLDQKPLVSLFTRPRRFGKTLNMDMIRAFFEMSDDDTSVFFRDKAIWRCGEEYRKHQGKYPVIFLTFKDVKFDTWQATIEKIGQLLQYEFARHAVLRGSEQVADYEKVFFEKIVSGKGSVVDLASAPEILSRMLYEHYGVAPVIIIDEYDTPIEEGYSKDFFDEIVGFMRNFFSGVFKDNKYLTYGFLTGILRIAQESIFSGLNNLSVNTIMDSRYEQYFGFTYQEVRTMLAYYGVTQKETELKEWYDGYRFGDREIYNPWSIINYISNDCVPQAYWVHTGKNEILGEMLSVATDEVRESLYALLNGDKAVVKIDQNVLYRSLADNPSGIFSLLFVAGYLTATDRKLLPDGSWLCEVIIPNKEIAAVYKSEILSYMIRTGVLTETTAGTIAARLYQNDMAGLQAAITGYLEQCVSFYDAGAEGFYHGMMLGLVSLMESDYRISSNRESGYGRFDICMIPRDCTNPFIIMEFKWKRNLSEKALTELAKEALKQIDNKKYGAEFKKEKDTASIKLGIAFSGKKVRVATDIETKYRE